MDGRRAGQVGRPGGVGPPGGPASLGGLGPVDVGPGGRVDDDVVVAPVQRVHGGGLGDVELRQVHAGGVVARRRQLGHELAPQLAVGPGDQYAPAHEALGGGGREGGDVLHARVGPVLVGEDRLLQGDGPGHGHRLVGQVEEGVPGPRRPVGVDQVGVGRARLQGLVGVAHALGNVDRHRGVDLTGVDGAETRALAQVHPGPEDPAGGHRDELVPGLGVNTPGHPHLVVEGDVVLHRAEVRQAQGHHLLPLPVLLEPPPVVPVEGQVDPQEAGDRRGVDAQGLGLSHWTASFLVFMVRMSLPTPSCHDTARPGRQIGFRRQESIACHDGQRP